MAETIIYDTLMRETGRLLPNDILKGTLRVSPILDLMEEGAFPDGMGYSVQITKFGAALPSDSYTEGGAIKNLAYDSGRWTTIGTGGLGFDTANNCVPPVDVIRQGTTKVAFALKHTAIESEPFCAVDLLSAWDAPQQMAAYRDNLTNITLWALTEFFRREYTYHCDNKVVVCDTQVIEDTAAGNVSGAEKFNIAGRAIRTTIGSPGLLTNGLLQDWHERLTYEGAGQSVLVRDAGDAVFQLLTSRQASYGLKKEAGFVDDWHYSSRASDMLQSLGLNQKPLFGLQHMIDSTLPKWNYTAGAWVKVEPYLISVGDTGYILKPNPDYRTALWQDSIIYTRDLMKMCFPGSKGSPGGTDFAPFRHRGEWEFVNNRDNTTNKDGLMGYFRGIFRLGAMPRYTKRGVIIRHAACNVNRMYRPCTQLA